MSNVMSSIHDLVSKRRKTTLTSLTLSSFPSELKDWAETTAKRYEISMSALVALIIDEYARSDMYSTYRNNTQQIEISGRVQKKMDF